MSAASFDENLLRTLEDPNVQALMRARGQDPQKEHYEVWSRQRGILPKSDFGGLGGRTPGIVPEFESDLTDMNRGQQMMDSTKRFYDSLEAPGIRDRVDAFVRGLGQTGGDMERIPLAGSPSFEIERPGYGPQVPDHLMMPVLERKYPGTLDKMEQLRNKLPDLVGIYKRV
jgi:hypothetical protein